MTIDQADWPRLDALLDATLALPQEDRREFLERACADAPELRLRLERLLALAADDDDLLRPGGALQGPVFEDATRMLEAEPAARPGQRLGPFEVLGLVGEGGMGRVYRARDPVLGREVAIKALAETFRGDPASLRRFEREARVLAALNHPNIAVIYGLERLDGEPYLVLELVPGETLQERLARGPLEVEQALDVARQLADGLEEAHRKGVVHRDLKPSNVKLSPGGRVKVLDFGLAKSARSEPGDPEEVSAATTGTGAILGTAPYMSPEQARGEPVDGRTDVWAFGCVAYEMLSGARAFPGQAVSDILAAVLRDEPDWSRLPPSCPPGLQRLLRRCLRKDRRQRIQDMGDVRLELQELDEEPEERRRLASSAAVLAALAAGAALAAVGFVLMRGSGAPQRAVVLSLEPIFELAADYAAPFAVSPDGQALVLLERSAGKSRLHVRRLAEVEAVPLAGSEGAWQPFFSWDGRSVGFFANRKLRTLPLDGSPPLDLVEIGGNPRGASWGPDGRIVLARSQTSGLYQVDAQGGPLDPLTRLAVEDGEASHRWPQVLPGGQVLFTVGLEDYSFDEARLELVSLATGERRVVLTGAAHGRWSEGWLYYVRSGRLYAARFDPESRQPPGFPTLVADGVRFDPRNGGAHLAVAGDAILLTPGRPSVVEHFLAALSRDGSAERLVATPRGFRAPRLSPDGRRIAVTVGAAADSELWVLEIDSGTLSHRPLDASPHHPAWRPDGGGITLALESPGRARLVTIPAEGVEPVLELYATTHRVLPNDWSPNGRQLVFQERRPETGWDLRVLSVDASGRPLGEPRDLVATPAQEENATVSPDGRFVAYESDELDAIVYVYVRPFAGGAPVRATSGGARWPRWGLPGELLHWVSFHDRLERVIYRVEGERFVVQDEQSVWDVPADRVRGLEKRRLLVNPSHASYDVDRRTGRLLLLEIPEPTGPEPARYPTLILGWPPAD